MRKIAFDSLKDSSGKTTYMNIGAAPVAMGRREVTVNLDGNVCPSRTVDCVAYGEQAVGPAQRVRMELCVLRVSGLVADAHRPSKTGRLRAFRQPYEFAHSPETMVDKVALACDEVTRPTALPVYDLCDASLTLTPSMQVPLRSFEVCPAVLASDTKLAGEVMLHPWIKASAGRIFAITFSSLLASPLMFSGPVLSVIPGQTPDDYFYILPYLTCLTSPPFRLEPTRSLWIG